MPQICKNVFYFVIVVELGSKVYLALESRKSLILNTRTHFKINKLGTKVQNNDNTIFIVLPAVLLLLPGVNYQEFY